jgi:hypothetical protein
MATEFQVTIDCASPHELADWWAEALGWTVEPSDEAFIRRMVEAGHATQEDTTTHKGVLVWKDGQAINSPDPGLERRKDRVRQPARRSRARRREATVRSVASRARARPGLRSDPRKRASSTSCRAASTLACTSRARGTAGRAGSADVMRAPTLPGSRNAAPVRPWCPRFGSPNRFRDQLVPMCHK